MDSRPTEGAVKSLLSVCLSVCLSVHPSVSSAFCDFWLNGRELQYLKVFFSEFQDLDKNLPLVFVGNNLNKTETNIVVDT